MTTIVICGETIVLEKIVTTYLFSGSYGWDETTGTDKRNWIDRLLCIEPSLPGIYIEFDNGRAHSYRFDTKIKATQEYGILIKELSNLRYQFDSLGFSTKAGV